MKRRRKALLSLFLALSMVISPLSVADAFAAEDEMISGTENPESQSDIAVVSETEAISTPETVTETEEAEKERQEEKQEEKKEENQEEGTKEQEEKDESKEELTTGEKETQDEKTEDVSSDATATEEKEEETLPDTVEDFVGEKTVSDDSDDSIPEETEKLLKKEQSDAVVQASEEAISEAAGTNSANIKVLKQDGTEYKMFVVSQSSAALQGDKIAITISTNNTSYSKLYLGSPSDENKSPVWDGVKQENGGWTFRFTIDAEKGGTNVPLALWSEKSSKWYANQLTMSIPDMGYEAPEETPTPTPTSTPTPEPTPEEPDSGENEVLAMYGDMSKEFTMFRIGKSAVRVDGDRLVVEIYVNPAASGKFTYSKIYLGTKEDFANGTEAEVVTGEVTADNLQKYAFSLPLSAQGQNQAFVPVKENGSGYVSKDLVLTIPDLRAKPEETPTPEPTPTTTPEPTPTPEPGTESDINYMTGGSNLSVKDIKILSSTAALSSDGTQVNCTITLSGTDYDRIYFGDRADDVKEPVVYGVSDGTNMTFAYSVSAEKQGMYVLFTPGKANGVWYTTQDLFISVPNFNRTFDLDSYKDGVYNIYGNATTYNHIDQPAANAIDKGSTLTIDGDTITLTWITRSNPDKIYIGSVANEDAVKDANAIYSTKVNESDPYSYRKFEITLPKSAIGGSVPYVTHTAASGWSTKQFRLEIGQFIEHTGEAEKPDPTPTPGPEPTMTPTPSPTPVPDVPVKDGIYNVPTVETGVTMFRVVNCQLTSKNGQMTAEIALSGTGYDYLYMGTGKEAFGADPSKWIAYTEKAVLDSETGSTETKYVFKIPVSALDTPLSVAARSKRYAEQGKGEAAWINRTITIRSAGIEKIADLPKDDEEELPVNPAKPTPTGQPDNSGVTPGTNGETTTPSGNDGKAEQESKYESDLSGSTSAVNSVTGLADGVYTPDRFTWSGGSGRVTISCNKVTVKNGQAYATIVFSSSSYGYVKANGRKYYGTISGNTSSFTIPVALNQNNTIIGMTTKMSADHEIQYNIYIYLAAAAKADSKGNGTGSDVVIGMGESSNEKLDDKAPQILGLTYESETKTEYAEYFRIYHYEGDITLLEIDMTSDTARDPEKQKEDTETAEEKAAKEEKTKADKAEINEEEASEEEAIETDEERIAQLYMGNVVKYLIVPEDVEVPVGLEKEVVIVDLPIDKTYIASKEALSALDELKLLDTIRALGFEKEDCPLEELTKALEKEDIVFGGTFDDIDYKALIREQCNLSILPTELLPRDEEESSDRKEAEEELSDETEENAEEETLTVDEQTERLEEIAQRHAMLWIPMMVDRSADEKTELGQYEWIKVYGALFGCEDKTTELFEKAVKAAE